MVITIQTMVRYFVTLSLISLLFPIAAQGISRDTLTVGYKVSAPFVFEQNDELVGASTWLWDEVSDEHDLPYKLVEMSLDSLLQSLRSGTIDLSLSPLTITSDRARQMDFSPPYYIAYSSVLAPSSSTLQKTQALVGSFFSLNFFRALGALVLVILVFGLLEWLFERKVNHEEFGKGIKGLWSGFWWSAVTMTTVGYGDKSPRTLGGRIVALIWMFTAIIIISGFTASIASSLTVNQLNVSQNRIEDFKERPLGTISNSSTEEWLKKHFFTNTQPFSNFSDMQGALKDQEIEAIAYDQPILKHIMRLDTLNGYEILPITYNAQFYAMGFRKNLPDTLKEIISTSILEQTERMDWQVLLAEYDLEIE